MENTDEACKDAKEILLSQLTTRKGSKETDSPQSSKAVVQMCKVCENVPGIPIYRSIACGSCRIFFLRHSIPQKRMLCKFDNNCCHKSSKAQVRCVACRYKKCLSAGLQPLLAGRRKHCRRKANDSAKDSPGKASSTTDEDSNELVEQHTQNIVRSIAQRGEALASSCCVYKTGGLCGRLAADVFFQ
ncbi:unnamed protein product, partial [Mesorhabditis belari]|uniref:Nuclear receptor domain-containing protein n=1 Tax=Mesorhabditis belari TaxID=2138241 RepID=A0AAF3J3V0_9BILA